jgi:hypothetical protein
MRRGVLRRPPAGGITDSGRRALAAFACGVLLVCYVVGFAWLLRARAATADAHRHSWVVLETVDSGGLPGFRTPYDRHQTTRVWCPDCGDTRAFALAATR